MMNWKTEEILSTLDDCSESFSFPMLENGYVSLAATRMSLFRSEIDWAFVIEIFGFSLRSGISDIHIYTFASQLYNRDSAEQYINKQTYDNYISNNPDNESRFVYPVEEGDWQDPDDGECVATDAQNLILRGKMFKLPSIETYAKYSKYIEDKGQIQSIRNLLEKNFSAYLSPKLLEALKSDAKDNHRSANVQLFFILEEHLKKVGKL